MDGSQQLGRLSFEDTRRNAAALVEWADRMQVSTEVDARPIRKVRCIPTATFHSKLARAPVFAWQDFEHTDYMEITIILLGSVRPFWFSCRGRGITSAGLSSRR